MAKDKSRAAVLTAPAPPLFPVPGDSDLLSAGNTLLNLAFAGRPDKSIPKGTYLYLVGDSGASKTWLTFLLFAEAARDPNFAKYSFVFDNAENGALMDVPRYFGAAVLDRLVAPSKNRRGSQTAQEFYYHVEAAVARGPCIYVLDSMDAIPDLEQTANFEAERHYYETGTGKDKIKGTMGMSKARTNSRNIAYTANVTLRTNGSILVVISQTRDKIGGTVPGQKTRSGGHALKFFAHLEMWTRIRAPMTKYYAGKDREIGNYVVGDVQKNRVSGWHGKTPLLPFVTGYGLDDVGGNIDYLLDEKHWRKPDKDEGAPKEKDVEDGDAAPRRFAAPEFDFVGDREKLAVLVQESGREGDLADIVAAVWRKIAAGAAPVRKPKYV